MDHTIDSFIDHEVLEYKLFRRGKSSQELYGQNLHFGKSKILYEVWQLLFKVDLEDKDKYTRRYLMYNIRTSEGIDTGYADHINMYHDIILMGVLKEVTFVFLDFSPSKNILHTISLNNEIIRNEGYDIGDVLSFSINKVNETGSIELIYRINTQEAVEFIDKSIDAWLRGNSIVTDHVLWSSQKQIEEVAKLISTSYSINRNGPIHMMNGDFPQEIDLQTTLLYLEKSGIIDIKKPYTSSVGALIPMIDIQIKDIPALSQLTKSENERKVSNKTYNGTSQNIIFFDKDTGQVFIEGNEIGVITKSNQEYYFFEYLYDRYNQILVHMDISNYIQNNTGSKSVQSRYEAEVKNFLSGLKSQLPEAIRPYIYGHNGTYQLRNFFKEIQK